MTAAVHLAMGRTTLTARWSRELLFTGVSILFGLADALLLIGWHAIDPANTDWIRSDPGQFLGGWEFLRHQTWTFPPTWLPNLDYPFGISAAYLDVIPIVALPVKLLAGFAAGDFQFFGIYLSICLVLQAYFALKLLDKFALNLPELLVGSLFFLDAPILLSRIYVHFSLSAQWLILAALFCYFRPIAPGQISRYLAPFPLLAFIAGGFTPYLSGMIFVIAVAALLRLSSAVPRPGVLPMLTWGPGVLFCAVLSFFVFGFLSPAMQRTYQGDGYTMFSLDLLSPFIRSDYLPGPGFEGYNYLGAGILFLLVVCIAVQPRLVREVWTRWRSLVWISLAFTIFALSVRITIDERPLFTLPMPAFAFHALAVFRSSGRFFWPVHYLLILGAIIGVSRAVGGKRLRLAVLAWAFVIQFVDLAPLREAAAQQFRAKVLNPLTAPDWAKLGASYRHLVVVPAWQCSLTATPLGDAGWQWFARLAAKTGMTLNSVHSARALEESNAYNCRRLPNEIARGVLDRASAYVLDDRLEQLALTHNPGYTADP